MGRRPARGARPIVDLIHSFGAAAGIQLAHAGRKASTEPEWGTPHPGASIAGAHGGWETLAPSAIAYDQLTEPTALDEAGIDEVVEAFVASAGRAVEAGFDMIEIHAAHGYLLHEFLSPLSNHRTDSYGGELAGRARLLRASWTRCAERSPPACRCWCASRRPSGSRAASASTRRPRSSPGSASTAWTWSTSPPAATPCARGNQHPCRPRLSDPARRAPARAHRGAGLRGRHAR
ncbi:hypothetical protein [Brachybacterium sp. GPGPB12]|uniref:oxidoreductase n=1 Tax=Brachybacterium sp. GPGPB12 TaxID=3023517 RepID=UPI0031343AD0